MTAENALQASGWRCSVCPQTSNLLPKPRSPTHHFAPPLVLLQATSLAATQRKLETVDNV